MAQRKCFSCLPIVLSLLLCFPPLGKTQTLNSVDLAVRQKRFSDAAALLKVIVEPGATVRGEKVLEKKFTNKQAGVGPKSRNVNMAEAQYRLATLYRTGKGVEKNHRSAFRWFLHAAENNHVNAQYAVGTMYENGWGIARDIELARVWYRQSEQGGHRQSALRLSELEAKANARSTNTTPVFAFYSLRNDNVKIIREFFKQGVSTSHRNKVGRTLLAEAMILGADRCVDEILQHRPSLKDVNSQHDQAVSLALRLHRIDYLEKILGEKPDLTSPDLKGNPPLVIAVKQSSLAAVKLLVKSGAEINRPDGEGFSPLDIATIGSKRDIENYLLRAGAAHSQQYQLRLTKNNKTMSVDDLAAQHELLVSSNPEFAGWQLVHIAAYLGKRLLVEQLLNQGISPLSKNASNDTVLDVAIRGGDLLVFQLLYNSVGTFNFDKHLISNFLNDAVDLKNDLVAKWVYQQTSMAFRDELDIDTLLETACNNGLGDLMVTVVQDLGVTKNSFDTSGTEKRSNTLDQTFICAVETGVPIVSELLHYSSGLVGVRNQAGRSGLWLASSRGQLEFARILLDAGAEVNLSDNQGKTSLMAAATAGHTQLATLLISNRASLEAPDGDGLTALHHAVAANRLQIVELLTRSGADIERRDTFSRTVLMYASAKGNIEMTKLLVSRGANIKRRDERGQTALFIAQREGNTQVADFLQTKL